MESVPKERIPQTPALSAHPPFERPQAGCGWENQSAGLVFHERAMRAEYFAR